jgi:beta-aspartyl-peptidase (threonine type)
MISTGAFGAVASIEGIQNPIEVASEVLLHSPHIIIMGGGARTFAVEQNIPLISINSSENREALSEGEHPLCDTVGAVAFDGNTFAVQGKQ